MIPILDRGHILAFGEYTDEVRFIVEPAVIAYLGSTERSAGQKVAGLGYAEIIDIRNE